MKQGDQTKQRTYHMGDKIKVLVSQVQNEQRGPQNLCVTYAR